MTSFIFYKTTGQSRFPGFAFLYVENHSLGEWFSKRLLMKNPRLRRGIFIVPHGTSFKIIGVFLGELGAQTADAAVKVAFHQRLKGREVAPLDGVQQVGDAR